MTKHRNPNLRAALLKASQEVQPAGRISLAEAGRLAKVLNRDAIEFLVRDIVAHKAIRIFHAPVIWPGEALHGQGSPTRPRSTPQRSASNSTFLVVEE